jgi:hypothetical protein
VHPGPGFRGEHHDRHTFGPRRHDGFGPLAAFRLLVPLALIGAGLWLLSGRRGPGNWSGPGGQQASYSAPPAPPAGQQSSYTAPPAPPAGQQPNVSDPPATGQTRIL